MHICADEQGEQDNNYNDARISIASSDSWQLGLPARYILYRALLHILVTTVDYNI